jgi:hypothetical protein
MPTVGCIRALYLNTRDQNAAFDISLPYLEWDLQRGELAHALQRAFQHRPCEYTLRVARACVAAGGKTAFDGLRRPPTFTVAANVGNALLMIEGVRVSWLTGLIAPLCAFHDTLPAACRWALDVCRSVQYPDATKFPVRTILGVLARARVPREAQLLILGDVRDELAVHA